MRIVSGEFRGRNLDVPKGDQTRPTMDRTRQAVFNILRSASWAMHDDGTPLLYDATVLDVFAGSGAMGFEALSQGAAQAYFFEENTEALHAIERNRAKMNLAPRAVVIKGNALRMPNASTAAAHIAFIDPPYHQGLIGKALSVLQNKGWIDAATLLVLEAHKHEDIDESGLEIVDTRQYGTSKIIFGFLKRHTPVA